MQVPLGTSCAGEWEHRNMVHYPSEIFEMHDLLSIPFEAEDRRPCKLVALGVMLPRPTHC